jgi:hypothetical protein
MGIEEKGSDMIFLFFKWLRDVKPPWYLDQSRYI